MKSISKSVYIDKLNDIVNKYNNTYHKTIKMKPVDVKPSTYIDSSKEIDYHDPKLKIGDIARISKYKNIFAKGYVLKKFLWLKKLKTLFRGLILSVILKEKKLLERFTKKNFKKQIKKSLELKKVIKRKGDKLYVKWKGYNKSFNSWIDKKHIV